MIGIIEAIDKKLSPSVFHGRGDFIHSPGLGRGFLGLRRLGFEAASRFAGFDGFGLGLGLGAELSVFLAGA